MVAYLSDEWLDAAAAALADPTGDDSGPGTDPALVVEHRVSDTPHGEVVYALELSSSTVRLRPGPAPDAGVRFHLAYPDAVAIARGQQSSLECVIDGRLVVDGDVRSLIDRARALELVDDRLAELRARTDY